MTGKAERRCPHTGGARAGRRSDPSDMGTHQWIETVDREDLDPASRRS